MKRTYGAAGKGGVLGTKSVWSEIEPSDGLRILATRYRGRYLPKERYDVWMASLGPSERLLRDFQDDRITWARFRSAYAKELLTDPCTNTGNRLIRNNGQKFTLRLIERLARKGNVTLLCQCAEDTKKCHRHVLQKLVLSSRKSR